jgi:geranylgeranyl pyrophosphate synthase
MNLNTFFETAKADIEKRLKDNVKKCEEQEKLDYFLKRGKRSRPLLSILVFRACGGDDGNYQSALDLAVAIELQHSASLVHDDIIDGDFKRRSKSSYYRIFGIEDAVLTGHRAIVLGFKNVLGHDPKILETFFDVWDMSLEGEIKDVASRNSTLALLASDKKLYFDVIVKKTASLFAGAAKIGSQEADVSEELQNLFWEYGKYIGIAYQMADDKLDFDNGNAELLPVSWIARRLDDKSMKSLAYSLNEGLPPSRALSKLNIDTHNIFNEEIARMRCAAENLAKSKKIPENEFRPLLLDAPRYIINGCLRNQ